MGACSCYCCEIAARHHNAADTAREWAWWLTMRELAAVAGLACWIDQAEFVEENTGVDPRCVVAIERKTLRYYARRLGWEAPDA